MKVETYYKLADAASNVAEVYWETADTEQASKAIAKELALHLIDSLPNGEDMAKDILRNLSYWLQPYVNPYWQDK